MTSKPKLDTNLAWQTAHAAIRGNREALLAIAGVFFFLPSLAFALLYPEPPAARAAMTPEQSLAFLQTFYRESLPYMLALTVAQIVGAMAILRLFTGANRPTVGDALAKGAVDAALFFAAMVIVWLAGSLAAGVLIGLAVATGLRALAALLTAAIFFALFYVGLRMILVMPVISVEGLRQPITALRRSWELTRGNVARIVLFLLLLMLVYAVVVGLASVVGIGLALVVGAKGAQIAVAIVTAAIGSVFTLYMFTSLAAIHGQLAGPSATDLKHTFD